MPSSDSRKYVARASSTGCTSAGRYRPMWISGEVTFFCIIGRSESVSLSLHLGTCSVIRLGMSSPSASMTARSARSSADPGSSACASVHIGSMCPISRAPEHRHHWCSSCPPRMCSALYGQFSPRVLPLRQCTSRCHSSSAKTSASRPDLKIHWSASTRWSGCSARFTVSLPLMVLLVQCSRYTGTISRFCTAAHARKPSNSVSLSRLTWKAMAVGGTRAHSGSSGVSDELSVAIDSSEGAHSSTYDPSRSMSRVASRVSDQFSQPGVKLGSGCTRMRSSRCMSSSADHLKTSRMRWKEAGELLLSAGLTRQKNWWSCRLPGSRGSSLTRPVFSKKASSNGRCAQSYSVGASDTSTSTGRRRTRAAPSPRWASVGVHSASKISGTSA